MTFLIFGHVDGDKIPLTAVERVGEGQSSLRLPHAAWTDQQEHANRPSRVIETGARSLNALRNGLQCVILSDDALG